MTHPWEVQRKFIPPQYRKALAARPRLLERLADALKFPLTLLCAGPGYGKTALLTQLCERLGDAAAWYSCGPEDGAPAFLLGALSHLFEFSCPPGEVLAYGESHADRETRQLDALLSHIMGSGRGERLLILDDGHRIGEDTAGFRFVEHLLTHLPPDLHVLYAARTAPAFGFLPRMRLHEDVLELSQGDLAFSREELRGLEGAQALDEDTVTLLEALGEGWILGITWLLQELGRGRTPDFLKDAGESTLGDYLRQEVFRHLPAEATELLVRTSFLDVLEPALCDAVLERRDSARILESLADSLGFVTRLGKGSYRLHQLFSSFLEKRLNEQRELYDALLVRAAEYLLTSGDELRALRYLLIAGRAREASAHLEKLHESLLKSWGPEAFLKLWSAFPAEVLEERPGLLLKVAASFQGLNMFAAAADAYRMAHRASGLASGRETRFLALMGLARIHLDTLEPLKAEEYLHSALALAPAPSPRRARVLGMMAENKVNRGLAEEASAALEEAMRIEGGTPDATQARLRLRSGRLEEARELLLKLAEREALESGKATKSHREAALVLSLIYAMLGDGSGALREAERILIISTRSPATRASALMRRGHARQILERGGGAAEEDYREALALVEGLKVERLLAEPLMGLALLYAGTDRAEEAVACAVRGQRVSWESGDMWFSHLLGLSLGIACLASGRLPMGRDAFLEALLGFERCGDPFGARLCRTWLSITAHRSGDLEAERRYLEGLTAREGPEYASVLRGPTLFGPRDEEDLSRLRAFRPSGAPGAMKRRRGGESSAPSPLGLLKVQTLGAFRVWLKGAEILAPQWRREKARKLFQLLLARRRAPVPRDVIMEALWPEAPYEAAYRDFRVALAALRDVLEPGRGGYGKSPFILKDGASYSLTKTEILALDVDRFESLVKLGRAKEDPLPSWLEALEIYRGGFLPDCLYDDWSAPERERLKELFLEIAGAAAGLLARTGDHKRALYWCGQLLQEEPWSEEAYRLMIEVYAARGNRGMALKAFDSCRTVLERELGVPPSPQTLALARALREG